MTIVPTSLTTLTGRWSAWSAWTGWTLSEQRRNQTLSATSCSHHEVDEAGVKPIWSCPP